MKNTQNKEILVFGQWSSNILGNLES